MNQIIIEGIQRRIRQSVRKQLSGNDFCEDLVKLFSYDFVGYVESEKTQLNYEVLVSYLQEKNSRRSILALTLNHPKEMHDLIESLSV